MLWCSFALVIVVVLWGRQKFLESRKGILKSDKYIVIPRLRSECRGTFWRRQRRWLTSGKKKAVSVSKNNSISSSEISLLCKFTWKKLAIIWGEMDVNIRGWRHWKRILHLIIVKIKHSQLNTFFLIDPLQRVLGSHNIPGPRFLECLDMSSLAKPEEVCQLLLPNLGVLEYLLTVVLANSHKAPLSLPNQLSMFSTTKALLSAWEEMSVCLQ